MTPVIRNTDTLSRTPARRDALLIIEAAYRSIDTDHVIRSSVSIENDTLHVTPTHSLTHEEGTSVDLKKFERIFIVGCGKVACSAAASLEKILGNRVSGGAVIGLTEHVCEIVETYKGSHPLPSHANFTASNHMQKIGTEATERDLVIVIVGGGGSAMLCATQGECDQGQRLYDAFIRTSGTIDELNIVRRHISPLKGGGLAKALHPATVIGLIFSDVPGGDPRTVASGPTYKDTSTIADAQRIIDTYKLGAYELTETPDDDKYFEQVTNVLLVSNETALHAMSHKARELGYNTVIPQADPYPSSDTLVRTMLASTQPRSAICVGAEPTLIVPRDSKGSGGRCSFTSLVAVDQLQSNHVFCAFASDGHDNSEYAGAMIDGTTHNLLLQKEISLETYRNARDSNTVFSLSGDLIETGPIDANVSDLFLLLTP